MAGTCGCWGPAPVLRCFCRSCRTLKSGKNSERIILVYSAREARELAYQTLIQQLGEREYLKEYAHKLTYLPIVTREQHPGALNGRITTLIENGELNVRRVWP